nr:reverse transcriptase domain-containing protein [Tanacetum cinerariifolium]
MSTRSTARNLFPPLDNPELTIRRRSHANPTLLNDFEMATEGNGDPPVPDLRTMEELCQLSLNGRGGSITSISIQAMNFGLKNDMIQQVQNSCQFHGLLDGQNVSRKYFPPSMVTKLRNEITNFCQRPDESLFEACECYKLSIDRCPNHNMLPVNQIDTFYNGLTLRHRDTINAAAGGTFMKRRPEECYDLIKNMTAHYNDWDTSAQRSESSSFISSSSDLEIMALKAKMAEIIKNLMRVLQPPLAKPRTYMLQEPSKVNQNRNHRIPQGSNQGRNQFFQGASPGPNPPPSYQAPVHEDEYRFITTHSETAYQGPTIPTTSSSLPKVVEHEIKVTKDTVPLTNNGSTKDVQPLVFQTKTLILNSEPLLLPSLSPPGRSRRKLNLMPLSVWNKLSLPELSPTCMTLKLADRLISRPVGVAEDVFVKVGTFHFSAVFIVVDFDADPRVPLIIRRSFLKTGRALIDVFEGELTLRVGKEAITFNLDQTSRYSANYNDMTANRIDVIDMDFEEYSQEVLGFSDMITSGNPTPYYDPIISTSSSTLTPFGDSDFFLEEVDAFLALEDDPTSPKVDHSYVDTEGDILLFEAFLNDDPSLPPPNQGNYFPQVRKELKICEAKTDKSSIDEPPEVEIKDLPPLLEYAFLEGDDKLPVIIAKDLSDEEKTALITVLKSHKRAIAWKLSDIKSFNPDFCTPKILMEDDFEPAVQHHRRVNPKIQDVIKKEVLKLLDAGLIYPISNSPWLNEATRKDHFPLPFMDQMLERLAGNEYYCFLDAFSGNFQIPIDPKDQEKTTFMCPYGTFAYHRMPFRNSFKTCLSYLEKMLKWCEDTNLCLNWEKSHFIVKEGIVLGHKISKNEIEVDKAKVDVIAKLPHPTAIKGGVYMTRKPLTFLRLATIDPPGDIIARTTLPRSVKERFRNGMKCLKIPSKFGIFLTFKASTSWGRSRLHEGKNIYSWLSITCRNRFGTPRTIISDRGTHFYNDQFAKVMLKYGVTHRLATAYHPQTSGQVEVSNRSLKRILERTVGENCSSGSNKLDDALWAFRTAYKTPIGCIPYKFVYEKSCHLPIALEHKAYWALKHANFDLQTASDHRKVQLNELNEPRDQAYENSLIYKGKTKRLHDSNIKDRVFNIGDRVLLFNSRLKIFSGKLKTRWSGTFTITHVFPYGTVELS